MKRTALILALTLAMAPLAQAQQKPDQPPVGATETAGGTGVGGIITPAAIVGALALGAVIIAVAGSDDDSGVVATSTTTTTSTTTGTTTATGTGR
jgi:hypothetical protein